MIETLLIIAAILAVAVVAILAYAATRPDTFRVARTVGVSASPDRVFGLINDLRAMNTWNPFDRQDPSIKGSYSGPAAGPGAHYDFDSKRAGTGSLEILESVPNSRVTLRLLMSKPMAADHRVDFSIEPRGGQTDVTWALSGKVPLMGKVFHLFCNMDKMIGGTFEKGLSDLKNIAEGRVAA
jgi:hypothetical protein